MTFLGFVVWLRCEKKIIWIDTKSLEGEIMLKNREIIQLNKEIKSGKIKLIPQEVTQVIDIPTTYMDLGGNWIT